MILSTLFRTPIPTTLLLLVLATIPGSAQRFSLFDVDASNFPDMTGTFFFTDSDGVPLTGLGQSDVLLTEDGVPVSASVSIGCPAPTDPTPMSFSFVIDRSGSMISPLPNGQTPLDLTLAGMSTFFSILEFPPPTAVSITGFNEQAFLVSDFRSSAAPLLASLAQLMPDGGTLYDPAFLDALSGGIELLRTRPAGVRRVLVFITDGDPNRPPDYQGIIDSAIANSVEVHVVTVGSRMPDPLRNVAARTGGRAYGNITSQERLASILGSLALPSRGLEPCRIQWRSRLACAADPDLRSATLTVPSVPTAATATYSVPEDRLVELEPSEKILWFGTIAFPTVGSRQFEIAPKNSPITVTGAAIDDPDHFRIAGWGGTPPPFTLDEGERRTITVEFVPTDTGGYGALLQFEGDPCPSSAVLLAGGRRSPGLDRAPLVLEAPLGGESFDGCDSVTIRWGGVAPDQPVRIQYSTNDGASWLPVVDSAFGYSYRWFPPGPGNAYRIKISTDAAEQHVIYTLAGGGTETGNDVFALQARLVVPQGIQAWDDTLYIAEAGLNRIRSLDLLAQVVGTAAGTGTSGNGGDGGPATRARFITPSDMVVTPDRMYIADMNGYKIRVVDRTTGIVTTYAGTGAIGFSDDGTDIRSANLRVVARLALDGDYLYLSELSDVTDTANDRVRRIDMRTGIITTVAGGGTFYDSDGGNGLQARLRTPEGIALYNGDLYFAERDAARVRRVDLKTGKISTVAGNGTPGFGGDGGPARNAMLSSPTDILFIEDRLYIAEGTNGNRIRLVDMKTGTISTFAGTGLAGFSGDSGAARNARLDEPVGLERWGDLLLVSDRFNERIRAITLHRPDGLDSSASAFSVVAPTLRIGEAYTNRRLEIDPVGVGAVGDSIVQALICNDGNAPLVLDSAAISGPNAGEFRIVGGLSNVPILPGECRAVTIQFAPQGEGTRNAQAVFFGSCTLPDTLRLYGTGLPDCGVASLDLVDFGSLVVGEQTTDSIVTKTFCNNGGKVVNGTVSLVNGAGVFSILSGSGPFSLKPGECLTTTLRFEPSEPIRSTALIDYGIPTVCGRPQTLLYGRGLAPQHLEAADLSLAGVLCPDDVLDTSVTILNSGEAPLLVTGVELTLNDEGFSILPPIPTGASPLTVLPGDEAPIGVRFAPARAGLKHAVLTVGSNDPEGQVEIDITGSRDSLRLVSDVAAIIAQRAAGRTYPHDTTVTLRNTGDRTMTVTGASLSGRDPDFFAVPNGQFPLDVLPGSTAEMTVQLLQPAGDGSYEADLLATFEPDCDLPEIAVQLRHAGTGPALGAEALEFRPIVCENGTGRDTTLVLRNFGGSPLIVDAIDVADDPSGVFTVDADLPITIRPSDSASITLHFTPVATGSVSARLILTTNTEDGTEEVELSGRLERVSFRLSTTTLAFEPSAARPNEASVTLTNTGTVPLTWNLSTPSAAYTVVSLVPATTAPGGISTLTVRYDGPPGGAAPESLTIVEETCGTSTAINLQTVSESGIVHVWLPHDSALINEHVRIPLRYRQIDGTPPNDLDTFETTIRFRGGPFFFESVSAGEVIDKSWDPDSREMSVTIRGAFAERSGDTLTLLTATALLAAERFTPLRIDSFAWQRPTLTAETADGSFLVLGTCFDPGLDLSARGPEMERVRPNPSSGQLIVDLRLPDWAWIEGRLTDMQGRVRSVVEGKYLEAGRHELRIDGSSLPDGVYLLRLDSPHGSTEATVVIVR